jgi:uncharacterized protein YjiS (DUF1127 family)
MNTLTCTLHHPECVERDDPVTMLKKRLGNAVTLLACWHARKVQRRQLLDLDAHLLEDVGISRAEALDHGQRPFWRE